MKKSIKIFTLLVSVIALAYYCYQLFGDPNGKKFKVDDKHNVYYKGEAVTKEDAKKAGSYFNDLGYFTADNEIDIQLEAENNTDMKVRFVVDKSKISPEIDSGFLLIGADMRSKIFPQKKLSVILTDDSFDDIKDLGSVK